MRLYLLFFFKHGKESEVMTFGLWLGFGGSGPIDF